MRSSIVFSGGSSRIGVASRGRTARRSVPTSEALWRTARLISINSASPRLIFNKYLIETPHSGMGPPGHVFFRKGVVVGSSGASNRPKPRPRRIAQQNPLRLPGSPNGLCPVNPGCRTRLSADRDTHTNPGFNPARTRSFSSETSVFPWPRRPPPDYRRRILR